MQTDNARVGDLRAQIYDDLASVHEVALMMGRSLRQIHRMVRANQLDTVKIGRCRYVRISSMRESLAAYGRLQSPHAAEATPRPRGRSRKAA